MVDAQSSVTGIGVSKIIPERIDALAGIGLAHSVGPTLFDELCISVAHLNAKQRIIDPSFGFVDIKLSWHDVEVARQNDAPARLHVLLGVVDQALEPAQFVVELRTGPWIAVRKIKASDYEVADLGFNVAAVHIIGITGQPTARLDRRRAARQDSDAVPAFLPMPDGAEARLPNGVDGKPLLRRLQFLQAEDVRLRLSQPSQEHREAPIDAVDVVGSDNHAKSFQHKADVQRRLSAERTGYVGCNKSQRLPYRSLNTATMPY